MRHFRGLAAIAVLLGVGALAASSVAQLPGSNGLVVTHSAGVPGGPAGSCAIPCTFNAMDTVTAGVSGFAWQAPVAAAGATSITVDPNLSFHAKRALTTSGSVRVQAKDDFRWSDLADATIARARHRAGATRVVLGHLFTLSRATLCAEPAVRAEGNFAVTDAHHHSALPTAYRQTQIVDITAAVRALCQASG